ncbi:MAG: hypothetical protein E4G89_01160 [Methanothrix sp.]|nr:MAG: hypothetical protein E4G89_01160 [Methanothrix sp.]
MTNVKLKIEDKHTYTTNIIRARKKLSSWFSAVEDVELILDTLPKDHLDQAITDEDIYLFMNIITKLMWVKGFQPITGEPANPATWEVSKTGQTRKAENLDVARSVMGLWMMSGISHLIGSENPTLTVTRLMQAYKTPELWNKLDEGEKQAVEKCIDAMKEVYLIDWPPEVNK